MLRITVVDGSSRTRLLLEGRLVGPWVAALDDAVAEIRAATPNLRLDLAGLRFADTAGLHLLRRLAGEGILLEQPSPFMQELLLTRLN